MKYLYFGLILIFVSLTFSFYNANINKRQILIRDLKNKVELASQSALCENDYKSEDGIASYSLGFCEEDENINVNKIDFDLAVQKFEKILFENLRLEDENDKARIKESIIAEALIEDNQITMIGKSKRKATYSLDYKSIELNNNELLKYFNTEIHDKIERFCAEESGINGVYYPTLEDDINLFQTTSFVAILDSVNIPYLNISTDKNRNRDYYVFSCGAADLVRK